MNKLVKVYFTLFALLMSSTGVWAQETITYLNYVGGTAVFEEATHTATQITSSSNNLSGWYYVEGEVTISNQVTLSGNTHLILCDGATLTIHTSIGSGIDLNGHNLTIYAQSSGSHKGKLIFNNSNGYGIEGYANVTINGGNISINSGGYGINCEYLTVNGGVVTVEYSGGDGIHAEFYVTINGGKIYIENSLYGISGNYGVEINGGQVSAWGDVIGFAGIYSNHDIYLGWTNASDYIEASSYSGDVYIGKNFNIQGGGTLAEYTNLDADQKNAIADNKLTPNTTTLSYDINVSVGITGGTIEVDKTKAFEDERVAITVTPETGKMLTSLTYNDGTNTYTIGTGYYDIKRQANDYVITMPNKNVTINATFETVVAKIGTTEYASLAEALDAVSDDETITIIADIDEISTNYDFSLSTKNVTINVNGHTVSFGNFINKYGELTITDKSTDGGGIFHFNQFYNQGDVTIENVTLVCNAISNADTNNEETLTFDNATVTINTSLGWYANNIVLKNGADVTLHESMWFAGSSDYGDNGADFTIEDDASTYTLVDCTVSGYNETRVATKMSPYVQPGKTLVVDGSTKNSMILKKEWGMMFVNCLPDSPVKTATVTAYKSATEPTEAFISAPGDVTTEFNANEYVVVHIVPEDGFWTDAQLLMATETGASLAPKRAPGLELGRPLKLLKADEGRNDGAGWYYYQIPATHTAAAGYLTTQLDGFVPTKFMFNLHNVSMSNNVLTVAQEDDPNVGWKAEITFDPATMSFVFDGNGHKPEVIGIEVKNDNMTAATLTAEFDKQFTISSDKRIGSQKIKIHSANNSWFLTDLDNIVASFNITMPLSGSGTENDPWQINNVSDMNLFAQCVNVGGYQFCHPDPSDPSKQASEYVKLFNNLTYDDASNASFEPVGFDDGYWNNGVYDAYFCGIFDGNGKTISNINYTNKVASGASCALGLFGSVYYPDGICNPVIKNLTLNNCTFKGGTNDGNRVGALAGFAARTDISGITITNCTVEGSVNPATSTKTFIGGLVALIEGYSKVSGCSISGSTINYNSTSANNCHMGGLVGRSHTCEISDCIVDNCTLSSNYSETVGGIVGLVYSTTIQNNRVKGNTTLSGNTTESFCRMGAIYGGSESDMSTSTFTNNHYDYGVTLSYTHSGGTATANGYTKRGYTKIQLDPKFLVIAWDDITDNEGAMMNVYPVKLLSVEVPPLYVETVKIDPDPSTPGVQDFVAGTNCYSLDTDGNPTIAVGETVYLDYEPTIYREDDGRTYHADLTVRLNGDVFNDKSFTMPDKVVNLTAAYYEPHEFTVATNGKEWMTFYHEWLEKSNTSGLPEYANYQVTDKEVELMTICNVDGELFETEDLDGISFYGVPTLIHAKNGKLPALLHFKPDEDGNNPPYWVAPEFKGVISETEIIHGIYVMNGNGDFIYAEPDPTDNKLKAHRCYIDLNGNPTNGSPLRWAEDTNSIEDVQLTDGSDSWYTISGVKLNAKPTKQGVYINNGKKVMVK